MSDAPRPCEEARDIVKPFGNDPDLIRWTASLLSARERFERRQQLADVARFSEP